MSEEINASVIKQTQEALSKYVKKPPLSEKLLKKPPFRYLHDIVKVIIKETGFLDGLYTTEELDSNNVKDKDAKIAFLDKLINAVKVATGENITVRSGKIVAGLEVNKTLELLRLIGKAVDEKIDTTQIVEDYSKIIDKKSRKSTKDDTKDKKKDSVSNDSSSKRETNDAKIETETKTSTLNKKTSSIIDDGIQQRRNSMTIKRDVLRKERSTESTSDAIQARNEIKINKISAAKNKTPLREATLIKKNSSQNKSTLVRRSSLKVDSKKMSSSVKNFQSEIKEEKEEKEETDRISTKTKPITESDKNRDIKNFENFPPETLFKAENDKAAKTDQIQENGVNENDLKIENMPKLPKEPEKTEKFFVKRKDSVTIQRPSSARPSSRKLAHNDDSSKTLSENIVQNEITEDIDEVKNRTPSSIRPRTATRPPSARPGAPRIRDRGEVLVVDDVSAPTSSVNVIEEGKLDQFGDDKDSFIVIESEQVLPLQLQKEPSQMNDTEQGQLVHQILKTQKELNESVTADFALNKQLEIEWEAGRLREKDIAVKEIEKIRGSVQALTSAANPLGKLFDFLQEDVDEMQRELQHWKNLNETLHKQQLIELELGKISVQPLQKQLLDIENNIQEEYVQIANIKSTILNNDEKLLKLIMSIGTKTRVK